MNKVQQSEQKKAARNKTKTLVLGIMGNKCLLCGYNKCQRALVFHRITKDKRNFKYFSGKVILSKDLNRLLEDLRKCILVCMNCHEELNAGIANIPDAIPELKIDNILSEFF